MIKMVKPGEFIEPKKSFKKTSFNNFTPRDTDYDELERKLLGFSTYLIHYKKFYRIAKSLMWHTNISPQIYMPIVNEQKEKAANTLHIENLTL